MRIDLHCHTMATKKGEPVERNISPEDFVRILNNSNVSVAAITNHNFFNLEQYNNIIEDKKIGDLQVWPGVELNITGTNSNFHLIVISNPKKLKEFSKICTDKINCVSPDSLSIEIKDIVSIFSDEDVILIAHFDKKAPAISIEDAKYLKDNLNNTPIYMEPANLRSAGILYAHNINSLIGSDVRDWGKYDPYVLPELKIPFKNYENFKLLIKKDPEIIKTFVNKKFSETKKVIIEKDEIEIDIYNDVNIFFGSKGTGKSRILDQLYAQYNSKNSNAVTFFRSADSEDEFKRMLKISVESNLLTKFGFDEMKKEFDKIRIWQPATLTATSRYYNYKVASVKNENIKKLGIATVKFSKINSKFSLVNEIKNYKTLVSNFNEAMEIVEKNQLLDQESLIDFKEKITTILENQLNIRNKKIFEFYSTDLEEKAINKIKDLATAKTGNMAKPSGTGLVAYYQELRAIDDIFSNIIKKVSSAPIVEKKYLGNLIDKGKIYLSEEYYLNPFDGSNVSYRSGRHKVTELRSIFTLIKEISDKIFTENFSEKLNLLRSQFVFQDFDLADFIGMKKNIINEKDEEYKPSTGETVMLLLDNKLNQEKDIYILDEPERSLGHYYINKIIIPRIKTLASENKKVIIVTHDANIAVRTLPFQSIFREYDGKSYNTYCGNPFIDELVINGSPSFKKSWTKLSLETLEGGPDAFEERGEVYGKENY
ncbi:MAG: hypothetical protein PHX40_00140 [Bacilli bacterium]|nr:hypothetical protein [Bacilli bacterium]